MGFSVTDTDSCRIIKVSGFLDGRTPESDQTFETLSVSSSEIDRHHVLDLSGVEYVNSPVMGLFVRFHATALETGYRFALLKPAPGIMNILNMTGLSQILTILRDASEIDALLAAGGPAAPRPPQEIDYQQLEGEIENVLVRGEAGAQGANELKKLTDTESEG